MADKIDTLHHIGILSRDFEATVARYEQFGFIFTHTSLPKFPLRPGGSPELVGVANRNAIFENGFLELLGVVNSQRWASITVEQRGPFDIDRPMRRYEGLHVLHFGTEDLEAVQQRLARQGYEPSAIRPVHRMVDTEVGPQLMRARSLSFPPGTNPEAMLQIAQHETPELALQSRFMHHPNGAVALSEVIVCVQQPQQIATKYVDLTGHDVERRDRLRIVDLGRARVVIVHPDDLWTVLPGNTPPSIPFLAGFTVRSDLRITAGWLEERAMPFDVFEGRILINARDACGSAVLFEPLGAKR